jgi:MerR family transcriptional regulator, light-induced transcriptional regulator
METAMNKNHNDPQLEPRHSIAVVSRRTGISQLVLRAWERRYAAVIPSRTPTGRRKYSDHDLQTLSLLNQLTDMGHRIGDVANLSQPELITLVQEGAAEGQVSPVKGPQAPAGARELMGEALLAVQNLDARHLEGVLNKALVDLSKPELRRDLLVPLMIEIGNRWQDGKLRVSHEHLATSIVVAFLATINARYRVSPGAPVLAVTTPSGQMHELGALLAASTALEAGWDVLYLGANLPAEDIASAVKSRGVKAVLLSLIFPQGDSQTISELRELRRMLGPELPILAGGQAVPSFSHILPELGLQPLSSTDQLENILRDL